MRETCEFIWWLEERFELVDTLPGGFPLWPALRSTLAHRLEQQRGRSQAPHIASRSRGSSTARWRDFVDDWISKNPYSARRDFRHLILEHPRVQVRTDEATDVHSRDLEDEWDRAGIPWLALTDRSPSGLSKVCSPRRRSTTFLYEWAKLESRVRGFSLPAAYGATMRSLDDEARRRFGVEWGAETFAKHRFRALMGRKAGYMRLLRAGEPSRVFILVAYGSHVALTAAARQLGLPVTEVQHGAFGRYHLGYAYPDRRTLVPGFPDDFLAWSAEWAGLLQRIQPAAKVTVREPRWMSARRERHADVRKERTVLVLSQGSLGDAVAHAFAGIVDRFAGYRIVYKLHPGEYGRGASYPSLRRLVSERGVEVLHECDLESEMARAEIVVGVYSTAIYEALELGCHALLLDLPGVENMQDLLDSGRAQMV